MPSVTEIRSEPNEASIFMNRLPINTEVPAGPPGGRPHFWELHSKSDVNQLPPSEVNTFSASPPLAIKPEPTRQAQTASKLSGVVVQMEAESVVCELTVGDRLVQTMFPPAIFPDDMHSGSCFYLEIAVVDGIRTPKVSPRMATPTSEVLALHTEIDALYNEL